MQRCLCTGRTDIRCTEDHCDIAAPGAPGDPNQCRICWLRLRKAKQPITKTIVSKPKLRNDCIHILPYMNQTIACGTCPTSKRLKVYGCGIHGTCTLDGQASGVTSCVTCGDYEPKAEPPKGSTIETNKPTGLIDSPLREINAIRGTLTWSYGVTTVPLRRKDLLPRTLTSLRQAGFDNPHLFVDGDNDGVSWEKDFGLSVTCRNPAVRTAGNWALSMYELYYRKPDADRFALFQDDFITYKNLRAYLSSCPYPQDGYLNCYTFPSNEKLSKGVTGWYHSNQFGRGAVALVFSRDVVMKLLSAWHMIERVQDKHRGFKAIDGGIVDSLKAVGIKEYVHYPSLTYHTGMVSAMGNPPHAQTTSFMGEEFDALVFLKGNTKQ